MVIKKTGEKTKLARSSVTGNAIMESSNKRKVCGMQPIEI